MTRAQAKAYVCQCAATILDHGGMNLWVGQMPGAASEADHRRVREAFDELVAELKRRGRRHGPKGAP